MDVTVCGQRHVRILSRAGSRLRPLGPRRMDALIATEYDEHWGEVSPLHASFVQNLIKQTPAGALILDAACGTGKYIPQILRTGWLPPGS